MDTTKPFDGSFKFTNLTNEDFVGKWDSKDYIFPAMTTSPIIIMDATPKQVEFIRKKFARDLAEREFFRSSRVKGLEAQNPIGQGNSIHSAASYVESELSSYVQKCLEPMPIVEAKIKENKIHDIEKVLHKDSKGRRISRVVEEGESLVADEGKTI